VTTTPFAQQLPATGFVDYKYAIFPHIFAQDTWVQAVEILPDNPAVVHHANLAFVKIGERPSQENFITGRVPGGDPMVLDEGTCVLIPKGSVLALQIHYTTTGKPERSKISVGLKFPRVPVQKRLYIEQVHTTRFKIPPLDPAHEVTARRTLNFDATGIGLFSHMHVRGKDMTCHPPRRDYRHIAPDPELQLRLAAFLPLGSRCNEVPKGLHLRGGRPFRQLRVQPLQPRSEGNGRQRRPNVSRDDVWVLLLHA